MKHKTLARNVLRIIDSNMITAINAEYRSIDTELEEYVKYLYSTDRAIAFLRKFAKEKNFYRITNIKYKNLGEGNIGIYITRIHLTHFSCLSIIFHVNNVSDLNNVFSELNYAVFGKKG